MAQRFQSWRHHFLLSGKIQIQGKQKLLPRRLAPGQLLIVGSQSTVRIHVSARSPRHKVKISAAIIISSCSLQCVTDPGSERQQTDGRRPTFEEVPEGQMEVNADEDQMVGNAVNDATVAAFPMRQTRKLAVRVIERIRANMEHHPSNVDAQITIEIKVSGNDPEGACQQTHGRRSHLQLGEKPSQAEPYRAVKIEIQESLDFTRLESRFDLVGCRVNNLRRH